MDEHLEALEVPGERKLVYREHWMEDQGGLGNRSQPIGHKKVNATGEIIGPNSL